MRKGVKANVVFLITNPAVKTHGRKKYVVAENASTLAVKAKKHKDKLQLILDQLSSEELKSDIAGLVQSNGPRDRRLETDSESSTRSSKSRKH